MAQLWGGRFTKETDKLAYNFNASLSFDQKFYEEDIELLEEYESMLEELNDLALVIEEQIFMLDYVYETYNRLLKKYSDIEVINMIKDVYLRLSKEFDEEKYKKALIELV